MSSGHSLQKAAAEHDRQNTPPSAQGFLSRLWRGFLDRLVEFSGLLLLCLGTMITVDVIHRAIFGRPIVGVFEISELLLLTMTFLALAWVQQSDRQLRIDIFVLRLRGRPLAACAVIDCITALVFFGILLVTGLRDAWEAYVGNFLGRGLLQIPLVIPLGILAIGTALLMISLLIGLANNVLAIVSPRRDKSGGR